MTAAPDRSLERYEIIDRIAVGGMAEVFRAKAYGAHGFEKTLAIKRILPDLARDPEFEQRFILEAKLAVQLAHANIVQVFDFGRFGGSLFIAMEHVEGPDLAQLLRVLQQRGEKIPVGAALHIAMELCKGLDYAHQRGVVHRDVSPSNILLSRSGEVKIADFGIAQAERDRAARRHSKQRRIMGKWRYMSPEQAHGDELTPQSDLFSAAVCIFEVFTGNKLFPGDDAEQVLENIDNMPIPSMGEVRPELPDRLDTVLGRALERDPERRPARAAELLRSFTEISYESSTVASAMDVAEVVASVLGEEPHQPVTTGSGRGIDDLIKAQLGGAAGAPATQTGTGADVDRRTEEASFLQTQTTFVRKGTDADGSTMWEIEEDTIAAVPSAIRTGRASGQHRAISHAPEHTTDRGVTAPPPTQALRWMAPAALLVAAAGVLAAAFLLGDDDPPSRPVAVLVPIDGGPSAAAAADAAAIGTLRFETVPPGATVTLDGEPLATPTPTAARVAAGVGHTVEFSLDGYRPWTSRAPVTVGAGLTLLVQETLDPQRATLRVLSRPAGASVFLDGELLGETPLERDDLKPGAGRKLILDKPDYRRIYATVDLVDGAEAVVERSLESAVDYGRINLFIEPGPGGGWANVYFRGKKLAEAPIKGLRLPVGKHKLRLENPESGRSKVITVDVDAEETRYYSASL